MPSPRYHLTSSELSQPCPLAEMSLGGEGESEREREREGREGGGGREREH